MVDETPRQGSLEGCRKAPDLRIGWHVMNECMNEAAVHLCRHLEALWFANVANSILWWAFVKVRHAVTWHMLMGVAVPPESWQTLSGKCKHCLAGASHEV
jgi:hypothetical protein